MKIHPENLIEGQLYSYQKRHCIHGYTYEGRGRFSHFWTVPGCPDMVDFPEYMKPLLFLKLLTEEGYDITLPWKDVVSIEEINACV